MIDRETKLFISVSQSPGNFGAKVYNALFRAYGYNGVYIPRLAPQSASALRDAILNLRISGCSVSTPLKTKVLEILDYIEPVAQSIQSVNTIVNDEGTLRGFNTDHEGVAQAVATLSPDTAIIYGNGSVVGAIIHALRSIGTKSIYITARQISHAARCAESWNVKLLPQLQCGETFDLLINATPSGNHLEGNQLKDLLGNARAYFDLLPSETDTALTTVARQQGLKVIRGIDMFKGQVQKQFSLYTGITPTSAEIERALI